MVPDQWASPRNSTSAANEETWGHWYQAVKMSHKSEALTSPEKAGSQPKWRTSKSPNVGQTFLQLSSLKGLSHLYFNRKIGCGSNARYTGENSKSLQKLGWLFHPKGTCLVGWGTSLRLLQHPGGIEAPDLATVQHQTHHASDLIASSQARKAHRAQHSLTQVKQTQLIFTPLKNRHTPP